MTPGARVRINPEFLADNIGLGPWSDRWVGTVTDIDTLNPAARVAWDHNPLAQPRRWAVENLVTA